MIQHREELILPYKPKQLYALVLDIESYPEFLPWCKDLKILKQEQNKLLAEMVIGYKFFRESFRCHVYFDGGRNIRVEYLSGPMKSLTNGWSFQPSGRQNTLVKFSIQFEFRGIILQKLADVMFHQVFKHMVNAFEKRAAEIYSA